MRIISWNTQGSCMSKLSEAYGELLSSGNDNIIMIQEGGNVGQPNGTQFSHTFGTSSRGHNFQACFFEQPNAKIKKCTTGMFVENGFTIQNNIFCYPGMGERPIVTCECTYTYSNGSKQDFVFATVHSTASEPLAEDELADINLAFRNQYDRYGIPWLIMGDFNCQADKFNSEYPINISYPPNMTHQNGKTLDFALYSDNLSGKIKVHICSDSDNEVPADSDHFPVYCEF